MATASPEQLAFTGKMKRCATVAELQVNHADRKKLQQVKATGQASVPAPAPATSLSVAPPATPTASPAMSPAASLSAALATVAVPASSGLRPRMVAVVTVTYVTEQEAEDMAVAPAWSRAAGTPPCQL